MILVEHKLNVAVLLLPLIHPSSLAFIFQFVECLCENRYLNVSCVSQTDFLDSSILCI